MAKPAKSKGKKAQAKKPAAAPKAKSAKAAKPVPASRHIDAQGGDDIRRDISDKDLKYLANYADECLNKSGHINSSLGQEISTYAKKGLNTKAFRQVSKEARAGKRDPIAFRSFLDDHERYRQVLGIYDLAAKDLFKDQDPSGKPTGSKPRKPRQADLSERSDVPQTPSPESQGNGADNVHSLDEHREEAKQSGDAAA